MSSVVKFARYPFFLMFSICTLLNLDFTILRSLRSTLAVVDLGSGAHSIPIFELFGALPGALLMTAGIAWLMNRYSIQKVFLLTLAAFLGFFLLFTNLIYPALPKIMQWGGVGRFAVQCISMLFYVVAELWKPALATLLFWGLVNQYVPVSEAKKFYAPLMLGGSLGAIIAGPVISFCTSEKVWLQFPLAAEKWEHGLNLMILLIVFIGSVAGLLYYRLWKYFISQPANEREPDNQKGGYSLRDSLLACRESGPLRLMSWIVIADYIAYGLGEVIFLDVLRLRYPLAADYCNYMGHLALWSGILTFVSSLLITPIILQRCRWVVASLITPICLLATEGLFFIFLRGQSMSSWWFGWGETEWIGAVVMLGSIQYCVCRGAKYTLFDSSKEIAFILIPGAQRMKGKLIVDGLCARIGRGSASVLSIALIEMSGGVIASSFPTGIFALGMAVSWVASTCKLGRLFEDEPAKIPLEENPITS